MGRLKQLLSGYARRRILVALAALAVAAAASWYFFGSRDAPETVSVQRGTVVQEVIVTGTTKPVQSLDLAFERGGRAVRVNAAVGARLAAGALIAALDESGLRADLAEAEANIALARAKLTNAERAVGDAQRAMRDKLEDAYTKADDAVRNRVDQFMSNPRGPRPGLNFTADPTLQAVIEGERSHVESRLAAWRISLSVLATAADLPAAAGEATANLTRVNEFLNIVALALNALRADATRTQATIDGWRSDVSTARTNVNAAAGNLSSAIEKIGRTPGDVAIERAALGAAEAKATAIRAELAKTELTTPIAGVITRLDVKAGEIVAANAAVASLISGGSFEIESNVPEVDIGKIALGNPVAITLDAFPGEMLPGRLAKIDPAETIVDGVVNYKITVAFERGDPRLKSGLTANLAVETARKSDVLTLPQYALIENDRGTYVRPADPASSGTEVPISIGIRSQDGTVEILSGLTEGERVMNVGRKAAANK